MAMVWMNKFVVTANDGKEHVLEFESEQSDIQWAVFDDWTTVSSQFVSKDLSLRGLESDLKRAKRRLSETARGTRLSIALEWERKGVDTTEGHPTARLVEVASKRRAKARW